MYKKAKDKDFIKHPVYKGGPKAMQAFISGHLQYPHDALQAKIEGSVSVSFDITHEGLVTDARVISGLGHGCDEEAIRLVKLLKFDVSRTRGLKVLFHKTIQIHFRLPKAPNETGLQYIITQASKEKVKTEDKPTTTGSYTITFDL